MNEKSFASKSETKDQEKVKTPEEIKKEEALLLAEKINEIQSKPGKTKEDYEEITRLAKRIENMFEEEYEGKKFKNGEVVCHYEGEPSVPSTVD